MFESCTLQTDSQFWCRLTRWVWLHLTSTNSWLTPGWRADRCGRLKSSSRRRQPASVIPSLHQGEEKKTAAFLVSKSRRAVGRLCSSHKAEFPHVHTPKHTLTQEGTCYQSSPHWLSAKRNVLRRTLIHFKLQQYWKPVTTAKYWYGVISHLWRGLLLSDRRGGVGGQRWPSRRCEKRSGEQRVTSRGDYGISGRRVKLHAKVSHR